MNCTGIILAGGLSSRMGTDKGLLSVQNKPMVKHVIDTFNALNIPIIIVANNDAYDQFNYPVYNDIVENKGPLGGLYTGLHYSQTELNVVMSCDTPYVSQEVISLLLEVHKNNISIAGFNGKKHPTIGVFNKSIADQLFQAIVNDNLKLEMAYRQIGYDIIEMSQLETIDDRVFANINTNEELNEWK